MKSLSLVSVLLSVLSIPVANKPEAPVAKSDTSDSEFKSSFFDAARVFGRAGCGDVQLATEIAKASKRTGLPANIIAAEIATESGCNPLAVSRDGGVGLMQVMPRVWASRYNNFRDKNLLKAEDSLEVGTEILAENVKAYGLRDGIRRYNGSGPDAELYAIRVMQLAGAR